MLRISTTHLFALKWLVPRMPGFTRLHLELHLRVDSNNAPVDLQDDPVDVAIRYGPVKDGDPALLFCERLVPVYSLALLDEGRDALLLSDLARFPLLCERSPEAWLQLLGENRALKGDYDFSRTFSHWGVLAHAAAVGQGVARALRDRVPDILAGRLRTIACRSAAYARGYRFLANPRKEMMPKVRHFCNWMTAEMEAMRCRLDGQT